MDSVRKAANRGQSGGIRENHKHVNKVAGALGKGKESQFKATEAALSHSSQPLNTLVDPTAFGPPPKHHSYKNEPAQEDAPGIPSGKPAFRPGLLTVSKSVTRQMAKEPRGPAGGLGGAMKAVPDSIQEEERKAIEPAPPPVPYRTNTTGIRPEDLPKPPPLYRGEEGEQAPSTSYTQRAIQPAPQPQRPQPPPRLPPRQNSNPDTYSTPAPPSYPAATGQGHAGAASNGYINQAAATRLGQSGVSVPALGVGRATTMPQDRAASPQTQPAAPSSSGQMSELQARFARMQARSASQEPASAPSPAPAGPSRAVASPPPAVANVAAKKAPPPPPPKKKFAMEENVQPVELAGSEPPPIPLGSKPK